MEKLVFIALIIILHSCAVQKRNYVTVIGKTGLNSEKGVGAIYLTESRKAISFKWE